LGALDLITWPQYKKELKPRDRLVLERFAWFANTRGIAWPGDTTLADVAGMSERSVQYAKAKLKKLGLIVEVSRGGGPEGHRVTSHWQMNFATRDDLPDAYLSPLNQIRRAKKLEIADRATENPTEDLDGNSWLFGSDNDRDDISELAQIPASVRGWNPDQSDARNDDENSRKDVQELPQSLAVKQEVKKEEKERAREADGLNSDVEIGNPESVDAALGLTALRDKAPSVLPKKKRYSESSAEQQAMRRLVRRIGAENLAYLAQHYPADFKERINNEIEAAKENQTRY